jgi:hypothetical protein
VTTDRAPTQTFTAFSHLSKLLLPHMSSARKGIDGGASHAPPEVLRPAMDAFYLRFKSEGGLDANRDTTKVYRPNGNCLGKPPE